MNAWTRLALIAAALTAGVACMGSEGPFPVEGSTTRISAPEPERRGNVRIDMYPTRTACNRAEMVSESDVERCVPRVDRADGRVDLSFSLYDYEARRPLYIPLERDQVTVMHDLSPIPDADWELQRNAPMQANQLFIVLIDDSYSLHASGDIAEIRRALLNPGVIQAFLPESRDFRTGVMLLKFSRQVRTIDGRDPRTDAAVIRDRRAYREAVRRGLQPGQRGYTHLYDAVVEASTTLLEAPEIERWIRTERAEPTIVLLTNGYHNESPQDTCATNVPRLREALGFIHRARQDGGQFRPTIYTVGLGEPRRPDFSLPPGGDPSERTLCGPTANMRIDRGLELEGFDNASLEMLADVGGGRYTATSAGNVADVFLDAAARRFRWYTVSYRVNPYYHRRSFETTVRVDGFVQGESTVRFHPSGWFDLPMAPAGDADAPREPLRARPLALVMGILGVLVFLGFLGAATFNARRALFRRARRR